MDTLELFQRLGTAFAIGLLIGLERGWRERDAAEGSRTAGIRTFTLIAFFGGVWGAMVPALGPWPLAIAGLGIAFVFAAFQWRELAAEDQYSVTGVIVAMLAFALGAMAVIGEQTVAVAAAVATTALLAARGRLHGLLRELTWPELRSAFVLLAMTFLLLPLLPDRAIDPWGALNPYKLWLTVILLAALSFVGYTAVRLIGASRGLLTASIAGALVSSTAVTLNNARLARGASNKGLLASATAIAWTISLTRQTALAAIINRELALPLGLTMGAPIVVLLIFAGIFYWRDHKNLVGDGLQLKNPFDLKEVLGLGLLIAGVLLISKILTDAFGERGLLLFAAISGTMDVDPITVSAAQIAGNGVSVDRACLAILIAACANLTTKIVAASGIGGARFGIQLTTAGVVAAVAGFASWLLFGGLRV